MVVSHSKRKSPICLTAYQQGIFEVYGNNAASLRNDIQSLKISILTSKKMNSFERKRSAKTGLQAK